MKAEEINNIKDAERFVEGCLNDLIECLATKEETMSHFYDYTVRIKRLKQDEKI